MRKCAVKQKAGRPRGSGEQLNAAERMAKTRRNRASGVKWRDCEDRERRDRLEANPEEWLRWYLSESFFRPFDKPHNAILDGAIHAQKTGGRFVFGAERGIGKSVLMDGAGFYFALSGKCMFPVVLPWDAPMMGEAFELWKAALCDNDRLLADYPEYCAPFNEAGGVWQRLASLFWDGGPYDGQPCGARLQIAKGRIIFPNCLGGIGGKTINGNPRGLKLPLSDGRVIRPDLALIDEPQDDEVAHSTALVKKTCQKIDGAVAGMAQAGKSLPMLMAGNFIATGDVMSKYMASSNWKGYRVSCIESWPKGWEGRGAAYQLWSDWWNLYNDHGDQPEMAVEFYREHHAEMVDGLSLSAPNAYRHNANEHLIDEFAVVMRQYFQMGHVPFMAERQQTPVSIEATAVLVVQPEQIQARAVGPVRGEAPEGTLKIVAGADINPGSTSRLGPRVTWAVMAVSRGQVAAVIAYGRETIHMPADPTQAQSAAACFAAIEVVRAKVGAIGADVMLYDARGQWAPRGIAIRYAMQRTPGIQLIPAEGWGNESYRPTHKTAVRTFEGGHESADVVDGVRVRWVAWNADHWQETALRAWLAAPGAPGSCIIHSGDHDPEFAAQCSMKRLAGKLTTSKGIRYDWADRIGDQDYGDAIGMCWAAAAWGGIGTGGQVAKKEKPKANIPMMRPSFRR